MGKKYNLPIPILRSCIGNLDNAMSDLREAAEEEISEDIKSKFESYAEILGNVGAGIINLISEEIGEDEFMAIEIPSMEELNGDDSIELMDETLLDD